MKAEELRISNLVYNHVQEKHCKVNLKVISDCLYGVEWHPVPLTEEWLIKAEFEKNIDKGFDSVEDTYHLIYSKNQVSVAFIDGDFKLWIEIDGDTWYNFSWTKIEYVHQLQNLYFALTNEELIFKP